MESSIAPANGPSEIGPIRSRTAKTAQEEQQRREDRPHDPSGTLDMQAKHR